MWKPSILTFLLLTSAFMAWADGTQTWEQSRYSDFEKGTANGVAIRSDGGLELAPRFKLLQATQSTYIWGLASDAAGDLYAAAGSPARVYRIAPDGNTSVIFEAQELQVQAVVERKGVVYAATSPDGKIYKLEPLAPSQAAGQAGKDKDAASSAISWKSSVFFEPGTKYIWNLAFDAHGNLYAATGDHGEIFRISPEGKGEVFFKSDDAHIRVLSFDQAGNLIAGTAGNGLIYRIEPSGVAFVLYSAAKNEITSLAEDDAGNIYASAVGEKRVPAPAVPILSAPTPAPLNPAQQPNPGAAARSLPPSFSFMLPPVGAGGSSGGADLYKIAPDGSPALLWSSHDDLIYALAFGGIHGTPQLLAGTGNKGRILVIHSNGSYTNLVQSSANQVTAFAPAPHGGLYTSTSNLGKVFLLGSQVESAGSYESDVFDAHIFSHWGRAELRGQGSLELFVRSGNIESPGSLWSPWQAVALSASHGGEIPSPAARFVQWKTMLHAAETEPTVQSVTLNYLTKNVAPVIDELAVDAGSGQGPAAKSSEENPAASEGSASVTVRADGAVVNSSQPHDHSTVRVHWSAHDDNDDELAYALYYRGDGETNWKPLTRDKTTDKSYSFDASLLPDGGYRIRLVASDAPSHSPGEELIAEKESGRFEIDTTPPRIENLTAAVEGGKLRIEFRAVDSFSTIRRAEFSIDARDWQFVEPTGKLSDALTEEYGFSVALPPVMTAPSSSAPAQDPSEHVVAVRVYDRFGNMGSAKIVVRSK